MEKSWWQLLKPMQTLTPSVSSSPQTEYYIFLQAVCCLQGLHIKAFWDLTSQHVDIITDSSLCKSTFWEPKESSLGSKTNSALRTLEHYLSIWTDVLGKRYSLKTYENVDGLANISCSSFSMIFFLDIK